MIDNICEDFELEETQIIESWINDNAEALYKQARIKKRRRYRIGKVNYWETEWGQLISNPNVNIPSSREGKLFKRRFRVDFGLFKNGLSQCA